VRGHSRAIHGRGFQLSNSHRFVFATVIASGSEHPLLLPCCLMDCFASLAMTVDTASHSRGARRPSCANALPSKNQRAQGKPGARCTRSLAWCVKKHAS